MKQENDNLRIITGSPSAAHLEICSPTTIINPDFNKSISALNEFSTGLSVGMTNPTFFTSYQNVVATQTKTFHDSLILGEQLNSNLTKINSFIETAVAPMSSVIADMGLVAVNTNKLYEIGTISSSMFGNTQTVSNLCLDVIQDQQNFLTSTVQYAQNTGIFQIKSDLMVSNQIISNGVNTVLRSLSTYPTEITLPNLEKIHETSELTEERLTEHQKKLDEVLTKIDPLLVEYRRGCWDTFRKKGKDYVGQSSSSMRRLVDNLLRTLAPSEKVMEDAFFKCSPLAKDAKGKPTKKARVFHIIKFDHKKAEHLERLTKGFLEAYNNLPAWDHIPLQRDSFVHGVFVTIEGYLISILSEAEQ